jgi:hypothetical protein
MDIIIYQLTPTSMLPVALNEFSWDGPGTDWRTVDVFDVRDSLKPLGFFPDFVRIPDDLEDQMDGWPWEKRENAYQAWKARGGADNDVDGFDKFLEEDFHDPI